ncbi:chord-domain-containing protein [Venturia nashicola]|uniref:Chord-domain-containing protein n=1 Tax=Venturia nashicola TaxID=86259 RepID=A0A4Z1PFV3_9PEZI|nr:chord-domain-containing protein [Venturia nashicola]TLD34899.1 chord-domain-containing protein [Venturia nashicola]
MASKCVHKGCGKVFTDPEEDCVYHSGAPIFHEGQKGWRCCKTRVLTFDEFLSIPPCTTGKHSTVDDTPPPEPKPQADLETTIANSAPKHSDLANPVPVPRIPTQAPTAQARQSTPAPPPESEDDDPDAPIRQGQTCRRKGCEVVYNGSREGEVCVHHPGAPIFHEGSKGYTCCKRRVLEFDQFLKLEGCKTKDRHLFVGAKKTGEEKVDTVRDDFYQTSTSVIASLYLKKIDKERSTVNFSSATTIDLDLKTSDNKRYATQMELYAPIDTEKSAFKMMGTKLEFTLVKADGRGWPVLKADDPHSGEIIQAGRAGHA